MIFRPELVTKVLSGDKTVTRRLRIHRDGRPIRYQVGKTYAIQPGRGKRHVGHVVITDVRVEPLGRIATPAEARREGFRDPGDFAAYWTLMHGSFDGRIKVSRIEFRLAERCERCL